MNGKTFAIHTLGCKVNTYESDAMAEALRKEGFTECGFEELADIYLINTCTVTNIADRKSRQMLRRARRLNPEAMIVAAGCYVNDAEKNGKLQELIDTGVIDVAVLNSQKGDIANIVCEKLALRERTETTEGSLFLTELDGHNRAFVKIQDGCNMFCSYCIIPYVRGRLNARPKEEILQEIRELSENGVTEVVLTGIHVSSLKDGLAEIIEEVNAIEGIRRIRLSSLEPQLITDAFMQRLSACEKLCPHFHLSLQSGCDRTLKRMNRHYTAEEYAASCEVIRKYYPHPAITTDIIVGFPGETEKDFADTLSFAEKIGFYEAHVFKYSRRNGTPADTMPDQLTDAVKSERSDRLIGLSETLSHDFRAYYVGKETSFISEELITIGGEIYETGYNREYVRCIKKTDTLHINEEIRGTGVRICKENDIDEYLLLV